MIRWSFVATRHLLNLNVIDSLLRFCFICLLENIVANGEFAHNKPIPYFPKCFKKALAIGAFLFLDNRSIYHILLCLRIVYD